jgi:hypothetical protein
MKEKMSSEKEAKLKALQLTLDKLVSKLAQKLLIKR